MRIRVANAATIPALATLRRISAGGAGDPAAFEARFRGWIEGEGDSRRFWLAEDAGSPIGMIGLLTYRRMPKPSQPDTRWGYVGNMFVLEEHRNRGVGRALIDALKAYADAENFERLVLAPSERSIPFWKRAGFADAEGELLVRAKS